MTRPPNPPHAHGHDLESNFNWVKISHQTKITKPAATLDATLDAPLLMEFESAGNVRRLDDGAVVECALVVDSHGFLVRAFFLRLAAAELP